MGVLHELALKHGSDKADHGFCDFYDEAFGKYRDRLGLMLEVGIKDGASHHMWLDYFPHAKVVGMDLGVEGNRSLWPTDDRFLFFIGDQGKLSDLRRIAKSKRTARWFVTPCTTPDLGGYFDLIVDDGGHTMWQQQLTFAFLWPHVRPGGWYVIEDLHTSNYPDYGAGHAPETTLEMVERLIALGIDATIHHGSGEFITSIIRKAG